MLNRFNHNLFNDVFYEVYGEDYNIDIRLREQINKKLIYRLENNFFDNNVFHEEMMRMIDNSVIY